MTDTAPVRLLRDGPVATLLVDRPEKRNALTRAIWSAIPGLVAEAAADPEVVALVVRGAGTKAFSGGADIAEFPEVYATKAAIDTYTDAVRAAYAAVAGFDRPTIALVHGACVGGGCGIALCCDLRFAGAGARFGITPAKLGLVYSFVESRRLVDLVGPARAKDILYTGRLVSAAEAERIGLCDRVVPDEELEGAVGAYVAELAAVSRHSLKATKTMIDRIAAGAFAEDAEMRALFDDAFAGEDFREGYAAFMEKRAPSFTAR